jgi:SAM-dependent methyltransferase
LRPRQPQKLITGDRFYSRFVLDDLVSQTIELPSGDVLVLQPRGAAELPDSGPVEWAPIAPYWAVLWRSGVALARAVDALPVRGLRVVELGCGLGLPSVAAARAGASGLATDETTEALSLAAQTARANGVRVETARVDWTAPAELLTRAPFDLALAADVLYERSAVGALLELLPRLAPQALVADPGRPAAEAFFEQARSRWQVEAHARGVVQIYRLGTGPLSGREP